MASAADASFEHVTCWEPRALPPELGRGAAFSETFRTANGWRELLGGAGLVVADVRPWNRIYASSRVRPSVKRLSNAAARYVPLNASYAFGFVCTRR